LFGIRGSNKIYVAEHGFKRHISSEKVFNSLGYDWENIMWVDALTGSLFRTAPPVEAEADHLKDGASTTLPLIENLIPNGNEENPIVSGPAPMVVTPKENTRFIGGAIETPVNTYIVADSAGTILLGKNVDDPRPIASFTKLMTAYRLAVEGLNQSASVTYNTTLHKPMYNNFRLVNGETVKNSDLWDSLLVSSLNLPANMLVSSITPVESRFIQGMNSQAIEWGMTHTAFTDPSGGDIGNLSTGREILTLWNKATALSTIKNTLTKTSYSYDELHDIDGKPNHNDTHTNTLQTRTDMPFVVLYSKTGYLEESGAGLVMQVKRKTDGKEFTIITMGNPDYTNRFNEPKRLAETALQTLP
jgi:D-alanyl-D-alanine carboxypeptidase